MGGSKSKEIKEITTLNLSNKRLAKLEDAFTLEELNPQHKPLSQLHTLTEKLGSLFPQLHALDLSNNQFTYVPTALQQLVTLTQLTFAMNRITSICREITALKNLLSLDFQGNCLSTIPEEIDTMTRLTKIDLSSNMLVKIPDRFTLPALDTFKLGKNKLKHLPKNLCRCVELKFLEVHHNSLESLPSNLAFTGLEKILLFNNKLTSVPSTLFSSTALLHIDISCNYLTSLPPQISNLTQLHFLNLSNNNLTELPDIWESMTELNELFLQNNQLTTLPPSFGSLCYLRKLYLQCNKLRSLPEEFGALRGLEELNLSSNHLKVLPDSFSALSSLNHLLIDNNRLTQLPVLSRLKRLFILSLNLNRFADAHDFFDKAIFYCTLLDELRIAGNKFTSFPESITQLKRLRKFFAGYNSLTSLPKGFEELKNLIQLHLAGNKFQQIPSCIFELESLDSLWLNCNAITEIPPGLTSLTSLCCLDLSVNAITRLPTFIGQLTDLEELLLSHNRIPSIPTSISELRSLKYFDISENRPLGTVPKEIFQLPKLQHLKLFFCSIQQIPFWELDSNLRSELRWLCMVGNPLDYPLTEHFKMITDVQTIADESIFSEKSINFLSPSSQPTKTYTPPISKREASYRGARLSEASISKKPHSAGPTSVTHFSTKKGHVSHHSQSDRGFKLSINMKIKRIWEFSVAEMKGIRPNMEDTISIAQSSIFRIPVSYRKSLQDNNKKVNGPSTKSGSYKSNDLEEDEDTYDDIMFTLFCVFDGHSDSKVAEFCACNFHKILFHKLGLSFNFSHIPKKPKSRTVEKESSLLQKPKLDPISVPTVTTITITTTTTTTKIIKTKDGIQQIQQVDTVKEVVTTTEDKSNSKQSTSSSASENTRQSYSFPPPPPSLNTTSSTSQPQSQQPKQLQGQNPSESVPSSKKDDTSNDTTKGFHSVGKTLSNEPLDHRLSLIGSPNVSSSSSRRVSSLEETTSTKLEKNSTNTTSEATTAPPPTTKSLNKSTDTTPETKANQKSDNMHKSIDPTELKSVQKDEVEKKTEPNTNTEPETKKETSSTSASSHRDTHKRRRKSDTSSASGGRSSHAKHKKASSEVKIKPEDRYDFHETSEEEKLPPKPSEFDMKIKKALEETFKLVSDTVADKLNYKSGCTAVVALFQERIKSNPEKETSMSEINENDVFDKESDKDTELEKIWFANCGDARAVSCRQDSAIRQSKDHKPLMKSERFRVQALGGFVSDQGRIQGSGANIAVARAIGDKPYQPFVSNRPYINCYTITEKDEFLVLACDGVWDVLSDQDAVNLVKRFRDHLNPPSNSNQNHQQHSSICGTGPLIRDIAYQLASGDNISVIVVSLKNKITHTPAEGVGIG